MDIGSLNPLVFYPGFPHITEQIFDRLDKVSLKSCRKVSKSWMESIDEKNIFWTKTIKHEEGNKAFLFACKNGIFAIIVERSDSFLLHWDIFDVQLFCLQKKASLLSIMEGVTHFEKTWKLFNLQPFCQQKMCICH